MQWNVSYKKEWIRRHAATWTILENVLSEKSQSYTSEGNKDKYN